jgi:hypothetical protein
MVSNQSEKPWEPRRLAPSAKRITYSITTKHMKSTKQKHLFRLRFLFLYPIFVLLCLKICTICANHAAKAVSFSVLA